MSLIAEVNAILATNAHVRVNKRVASEGTATARGEALRSGFRLLRTEGFKIEHPHNLNEKYIKALCIAWHAKGRTAKTMGVYLSHFRIFAGWIGKPGLVKNLPYYLPDVPKADLRATTVAEQSKSWAENGVDVCQKILEADTLDWRFGLMVRLQVAFGLRRHEVLRLQIWKVHQHGKIAAKYTKGGRPRDIYVETDAQNEVVEFVKSKIKGKDEYIGWLERKDGKPFRGGEFQKASLKYSSGRYDRLMAKLGITKQMEQCTGHGLRAQFAENASLIKNMIPSTLGGTGGQMPRGDSEVARLQISEALGHSRLSVTTAYLGSFGRDYKPDAPERIMKIITAGMDAISLEMTSAIPGERLLDCMKLSNELIAIQVFGDPRKIQVLWENHSRRHATEWLAPSNDANLAALEVAARSILGLNDPENQPATP